MKVILSVPDEGYSERTFILSVPDDGFSRNASCALNLISMFLLSLINTCTCHTFT